MSEPLYLIWSHEHCRWWATGNTGYTRDLWAAGRYSWADADRECRQRSWEDGKLPPEVMVLAPEDDHLTFTAAELRNIDSLMNVRIAHATDMARERREAGG